MNLNKETYADSTVYKKGDSITITSHGVLAGYYAGSSLFRVCVPMNRPVVANGATISLLQTQLGMTTVNGMCHLTNAVVSDVQVKPEGVSFSLSGNLSTTVTSLTPISMGIDATITFT